MGNIMKKETISITEVTQYGFEKSLLPPERLKKREAVVKRHNRIIKRNEMVATKTVEEEVNELLPFVSSSLTKEEDDGNDQKGNFKMNLNVRLVARLRRLIKEDLYDLNDYLGWGIYRSSEQHYSEHNFRMHPALDLYFAVARDIQRHVLSPSSSITTVSVLHQLPYPLLPELKVWIDSPDDRLQNSKRRIKLWRKALEMYIEYNRQDISCTYKIDL